jgi:hypothetical protein
MVIGINSIEFFRLISKLFLCIASIYIMIEIYEEEEKQIDVKNLFLLIYIPFVCGT